MENLFKKRGGCPSKHYLEIDDDRPSTAQNVGPIQDQGMALSQDGQCLTTHSLPGLHKKFKMVLSETLRDSLADWFWATDGEHDSSVGEKNVRDETSEELQEEPGRKRYESSDNLMDGLGRDLNSCTCNQCQEKIVEGNRMLQCISCGPGALCGSCCIEKHARLPLHQIESWNGSFWAKSLLYKEGLTYQLGHGGFPCRAADPKLQEFTVMGNNSIQTVRVAWCGCDRSDSTDHIRQLLSNGWYLATVVAPQTVATFETLDAFRVMNVIGSLNVRDYVSSLEVLTDGMRSSDVVDRYKSFGRMQHQYTFLLQMKRAGRAHEPGGICGTPPGGAAVLCWACLHEGVNMPEGWQDIDPEYHFLYTLFIMMDANFRMKNRLYANMDYIFFSSILGCALALVFLTYDIACQYGINLEKRNALLPLKLHHDFEKTEIKTALPVWHGDVHILDCRSKNLVQYQDGAGKLDGEAPECFWSKTNGISYAMKEMGEGTRNDAIEDRLGCHNHRKNVNLDAKLCLALVQEANQKREFKQINLTIEDDLLQQWEDMYEKWLEDRDRNLAPFVPTIKDRVTEAEVRFKMKKDEVEEAKKDSFLMSGLELEETQRRLKVNIKTATTTTRKSKVEEQKRQFYAKLKVFRQQQEIFMPGAIRIMEEEEEKRDSEEAPPSAEDIKLWLPLDLVSVEQRRGCRTGMLAMEVKLREAQCTDALSQVRGRLYAKRYLISYRNTHVTGQHGGMKA
ncbi:hypothetical protein C8J56DRAFT_1126634 [Mycena floridula]|nr:hypothetical protein C8J56DRAFT_1126634 [Mycena floridula]